jgi:hypothetical protein
MKKVDYMKSVKKRELTWNEKLALHGIPSWEIMQAEIKSI